MSNFRIFVVDEDPDFRAELCSMLTNAGFSVAEAENAATARDLFAKESFDLAILGVKMEAADSGFTLAFEMKSAKPSFPIIIASELNNKANIKFSLDNPSDRNWIKADAFLNRPLRPEQLVFQVKKLLGCTCCCGH